MVTLSKEIVCKRGLKQGNCLSLVLLVLVAEGLNKLFRRMEGEGKIMGLMGVASMAFTNLQYVDTTLIFGQCSVPQAIVVKWVLNCFEAWSALRINFDKSSLILIGQEIFTNSLTFKIISCQKGISQ